MITLKIHIHLLSDAEPGTGLGNETINALVPTDGQDNPIIPASHLKGLLRDQVQLLATLRAWPSDIAAALFGEPGDTATDGTGLSGVVQLEDARASEQVQLVTITRTRIGPLGTADANSLRTVQAIPAGTTLSAKIRFEADPGSVPDQAIRLALMSIEALGGGRTRGAGACRISIDGEERTPGALLRLLEEPARSFRIARTQLSPVPGHVMRAGDAQWFRLVFRSTTPLCCPEVPINGSTNHVRSGPVVPASAVQGALITRIDQKDPALATACLQDPRFRAWPLLPVRDHLRDKGDDPLPLGIRVDLSHRMSKLKDDDGKYRFADPAVDGRHWSESRSGSPFKSSDGILRRDSDGAVSLWRAVDLPRHITSHGVHHAPSEDGRRNLFSVESLAPMTFTGLVALPKEAADCLRELLSGDPIVAFGKARSMRGMGELTMSQTTPEELFSSSSPAEAPGRVFVVQSPVVIPDEYRFERSGAPVSAEEALEELASSWGKVKLRTPRDVEGKSRHVARTAAACGVRFGWNRHGVGKLADKRHRRLRARRVFLPGTVVVFSEPVSDLEAQLLAGLGEGREEGFGCLLPHLGIATNVYRPHEKDEPEQLKNRDEIGTAGYDLFKNANGSDGPSPSQIGKLVSLAKRDPKEAVEHLTRQMLRGPARHWHRWEPVVGRVKELLAQDAGVEKDARVSAEILRVWQDLAIIHRSERKEH